MDNRIQHTIKTALYALGCIALMLCVLLAMTGCSQQDASAEEKTLEDFTSSRVAVITGSYQHSLVETMWPQAKLSLYNTTSDVLEAVSSGKVDCGVMPEPSFNASNSQHPDLMAMDADLPMTDAGFIWPKGSSSTELYRQMNEYLARIKEDGTLTAIMDKWQGTDDSLKTIPPVSDLSGENGTIACIVSASEEPVQYWKGNRIVGSVIDVVYQFCQEYGYTYTIDDTPFESLIMGLSQGRYDLCPSILIYTPERKESVDFGEPLYTFNNVVVYKSTSSNAGSEGSFIDNLIASFKRTFVSENRWEMILSGLGVTLLVALLAAIFGTILGFGLSLLRHYSGKTANKIIDVYVRLLQGTPVLVLLLIFYYVIFGSVTVSSILVSVIVFTLNTSANICENLSSCIASVHPGQREAAIAAGFTERQAFTRFVLPIAIQRAMPVYVGELVSLVKSTSIVGYIALVDLTKAGDIIRSRTYEAIFPLLAIALIYLFITWIVSLLLKALARTLTPERPKTSIKGVVLQDTNET